MIIINPLAPPPLPHVIQIPSMNELHEKSIPKVESFIPVQNVTGFAGKMNTPNKDPILVVDSPFMMEVEVVTAEINIKKFQAPSRKE